MPNINIRELLEATAVTDAKVTGDLANAMMEGAVPAFTEAVKRGYFDDFVMMLRDDAKFFGVKVDPKSGKQIHKLDPQTGKVLDRYIVIGKKTNMTLTAKDVNSLKRAFVRFGFERVRAHGTRSSETAKAGGFFVEVWNNLPDTNGVISYLRKVTKRESKEAKEERIDQEDKHLQAAEATK